jgi:hypothetical protein
MGLRSDFHSRARRRDLKSYAVGAETLGDIIQRTITATGHTQLDNGEYDTFDITLTQENEEPLAVPEVYIAIYIGSVASANLLFDGSTAAPGSADPTAFNVIGPFYNWDEWNKEKWQTKVTFTITNVSNGANTDIYVYTQSKIITRAKAQ